MPVLSPVLQKLQCNDQRTTSQFYGNSFKMPDPSTYSLKRSPKSHDAQKLLLFFHFSEVNRDTIISQLSSDFYAATGRTVSRVAVSKSFLERGPFARKHNVSVTHISVNRRLRSAWYRDHRDWMMKIYKSADASSILTMQTYSMKYVIVCSRRNNQLQLGVTERVD